MARRHSSKPRKDLTGQTFGNVFVIEFLRMAGGNKGSVWLCKCRCGKKFEALGKYLSHNEIKNCQGSTHGQKIEHSIWQGMIDRCHNPNSTAFINYGGRGIIVCTEWRQSFLDFFLHIGPRPNSDHSIDRIDNDGNYEPGNVRWATRNEQALNRRNTIRVIWNGIEMSCEQAANHSPVCGRTIKRRILKGWNHSIAITTPAQAKRPTKYNKKATKAKRLSTANL